MQIHHQPPSLPSSSPGRRCIESAFDVPLFSTTTLPPPPRPSRDTSASQLFDSRLTGWIIRATRTNLLGHTRLFALVIEIIIGPGDIWRGSVLANCFVVAAHPPHPARGKWCSLHYIAGKYTFTAIISRVIAFLFRFLLNTMRLFFFGEFRSTMKMETKRGKIAWNFNRGEMTRWRFYNNITFSYFDSKMWIK